MREFAESSDRTVAHIHLFGDTGVWKSPATYDALAAEGVRHRGIVAPGIEDVDRSRLAQVVETDDAHLVLVVDDCTWDEALGLEKFASAAVGRIRLITIGDRPTRDTRPQRASLDIERLGDGVIADPVSKASGIRKENARLVADIAEGFPKLAIEIARSLKEVEAGTLADILRQQPM